MRQILLSVVLCAISIGGNAQTLWQSSKDKILPQASPFAYLSKVEGNLQYFDLNGLALEQTLIEVPLEGENSSTFKTIDLPMPDGSTRAFTIVEYEIYSDGLHTAERAFYGTAVDNPLIRMRADVTAHGFRAMIFGETDVFFIEPMTLGDPSKGYVVFGRKGLASTNGFGCNIDDLEADAPKASQGSSRQVGDCLFRTYRLAIAVTGEYSNYFGATSSAQSGLVSAAVITTMNRVNGVFETESAVRMILLGNTANSFYYNPATDPYTDGSAGAMLNQNTPNLNNVYGSSNYDIGHVFGADGGNGVAYLGSVCGSDKGGGVTLRDNPVGDPFDIDYVAHEMGHQFGATHTQNNSCNRTNSSAYEPGSASSILGYAGICAPNVQQNSDPYFHSISLVQIASFVQGSGNGCAASLAPTNNQPTVSAGQSVVLPKGTPFSLTASGSDPNGDVLTYQWEHYDNGIASMPPSPTSTTGPNFRSLTPTASPTRFFPAYNDVLQGSNPTWEVLPTVARSSTFRAIARDNQIGGCTDEADITVTWDNSGPFEVNSPDATSAWVLGQSTTITWAVNGTNTGAVACGTVNLELSTDGGQTFGTTIASNVPNTGSYALTIPANYPISSQARVRATCADGRFYNLSQTFTISATQPTILCQTFVSTDVPKAIGPNLGTITSSVVSVSVPGPITDVNVLNVQGTHSWVDDIEMDLLAPNGGTLRRLMYDPCTFQENFSLSFDSQASNAYNSWPCPPTDGGSYQPLDDLSAYNGNGATGTWTLQITDDANDDGGSLTGWSLEVCYDSSVPLPVELTKFTASTTEDLAVQLEWETASEDNADRFDVLRWEDGQTADFRREASTLVDRVAAKHPEGASYDILDQDVEPGNTYYYQLSQKDWDGSFHLSDVVAVKLAENGSKPVEVFDGATAWMLRGLAETVGQLELVDALGRVQRRISVTSEELSISKAGLPVGWYALVFGNERIPVVVR